MHAHRSPEDYNQRSTGHFREESICSLPYLIQQKRTLCSQKTLFSLWEDTDPNTVVWTHIILSKLHISTVQLTAESSQVARCIYTVTKKQFAQELFTDMRVLPFKAMLWLSFPPHYAGCSAVCSLLLCLFLSPSKKFNQETVSAAERCGGHKHGAEVCQHTRSAASRWAVGLLQD